jgi:hypothetical protein
MVVASEKTTDTIPRASLDQLFGGLGLLHARGGRATFEDLRVWLLRGSRRRAPNTMTAMWTVARDVLSELEKLKLATVGVLPRKLSDVNRLRDTPCEILPSGAHLVDLYTKNIGQAYDAILSCWLAQHPYFRALMVRVLKSPLYVPDVTNVGQLGHDDVKAKRASAILTNLVNDCTARLEHSDWTSQKLNRFRAAAEHRVTVLHHAFIGNEIDTKRLVDAMQDGIVLPSFLEAEELTFDAVTFQQLLRISQEFLVAAWTTSHPSFSGRIVFPVCEFHPALETSADVADIAVAHHGVSYAEPLFPQALRDAYSAVAAGSPGRGYASAYSVRAIVCLALQIPPIVFARSLEALISIGPRADLTIYTELPFEPPPQGEDYVEVSKRRIGLLKLVTRPGD